MACSMPGCLACRDEPGYRPVREHLRERQVPFQRDSTDVFSTSYGRDGRPIRRPNFDLKLPKGARRA